MASAIVYLPNRIDAGRPYVNVVLHLERGGTAIADHSMNYDTLVVTPSTPIGGGSLPASAGSATNVPCFDLTGQPPSLYVGLAPPAGTIPGVFLPEDGAPPPFDELKQAVTQVLAVDPAIIDPAAPAPDLAVLTPQQCTHIARELLWRRTTVNPVPLAVTASHDHVPLEQLYTGPPATPPSAVTSFQGDRRLVGASRHAGRGRRGCREQRVRLRGLVWNNRSNGSASPSATPGSPPVSAPSAVRPQPCETAKVHSKCLGEKRP